MNFGTRGADRRYKSFYIVKLNLLRLCTDDKTIFNFFIHERAENQLSLDLLCDAEFKLSDLLYVVDEIVERLAWHCDRFLRSIDVTVTNNT